MSGKWKNEMDKNRNLIQIYGHFIDINKIYPNFIVVDGGACRGELFDSLREFIDEKSFYLYGFECCKSNFNFLIDKNENKNIKYYSNALVGDGRNEQIEFMEVISNHDKYKEWGNVSGLYEKYLQQSNEVIKIVKYYVKTLSINNIFEFLCIDKIDYLKLDTEGTESEIVMTMSEQTAKKIDQISMEIHSGKKEQDILLKRLIELGYSFHKFKVESQSELSNELYVSKD